jgi:hypothetical protein
MGVEAKNAFQSLKVFFTTALLLIYADPTKLFVSKMDVLDFAFGTVLSQPGKDNFFHHVGFCSCKFSLAKIKYEIHDKEFIALWMLSRSGIICLKEFKMKLLCIEITRTCSIS